MYKQCINLWSNTIKHRINLCSDEHIPIPFYRRTQRRPNLIYIRIQNRITPLISFVGFAQCKQRTDNVLRGNLESAL